MFVGFHTFQGCPRFCNGRETHALLIYEGGPLLMYGGRPIAHVWREAHCSCMHGDGGRPIAHVWREVHCTSMEGGPLGGPLLMYVGRSIAHV